MTTTSAPKPVPAPLSTTTEAINRPWFFFLLLHVRHLWVNPASPPPPPPVLPPPSRTAYEPVPLRRRLSTRSALHPRSYTAVIGGVPVTVDYLRNTLAVSRPSLGEQDSWPTAASSM